jgi:hypothetical protein
MLNIKALSVGFINEKQQMTADAGQGGITKAHHEQVVLR